MHRTILEFDGVFLRLKTGGKGLLEIGHLCSGGPSSRLRPLGRLLTRRPHAGDSYAQFVFAWALICSGQTKLAFESIKKATVAGFPPATLDFATFIWSLPGKKASDAAAALKALRFAYRARHKAAAVWRYDFYKSGRVGLLRCPLGYLLSPLALASVQEFVRARLTA